MKSVYGTALLGGLLWLNTQAWGASGKTLTFGNSSSQSKLIELFTSQGCSSCPPAEKWINQFYAQKELWKTLFPVAFHVTYWDYLGWKDPYSKPEYTDRQHQYADAQRVKSIYTPGFVVNAQEWRGWFNRDKLPHGQGTQGLLTATFKGDSLMLQYTLSATSMPDKDNSQKKKPVPASQSTPLIYHVCISKSNSLTKVKSGENSGKNLKQHFVSVFLETYPGTTNPIAVKLPTDYRLALGEHALTAWVNKPDNLTPLQIVGGWIK